MVNHARKTTVAVLCAARNSVYHALAGVEVYDIDRNAMTFPGGMPVVAHPPCRAWSAYCRHQAKPLPGEKDLAPWCVEQVRANGGVLEHPANSCLWNELRLPRPGGPVLADGWSMAVNQSWFGDTRTKKTWLFIVGVGPHGMGEIPFRLHSPKGDRRRWQLMSKNQRAATCRQFAEWLIVTARQTVDGMTRPLTLSD
jgi:hypothetical protein